MLNSPPGTARVECRYCHAAKRYPREDIPLEAMAREIDTKWEVYTPPTIPRKRATLGDILTRIRSAMGDIESATKNLTPEMYAIIGDYLSQASVTLKFAESDTLEVQEDVHSK